MSGVKGRTGGARRGSGARQRRILLSAEDAQKIHIVLLHRRSLNPNLCIEAIISQLIDHAWQEVDALYQEKAE